MRVVLGLETSCDETAAAVVREDRTVLSNIVVSQLEQHQPYGGVVPEIAARSHLQYLNAVVTQAMQDAKLEYRDLSAVAATAGPGLIGGVIIGTTFAKTLAIGAGIPFVAVNHLEAHALTPRFAVDLQTSDIKDSPAFPYLLLLVSGGHCQLFSVRGVGSYTLYGSTLDDAVGEAFDKTAKLLGLDYPGGPAIEAAACDGCSDSFILPRPMIGRTDLNFSFAGLKSAIRRLVGGQTSPLSSSRVADICASFQAAVIDILVDRCEGALARFRQENQRLPITLVVAGGVAANQSVRSALKNLCQKQGAYFAAPPLKFCTDNGAMVAWAGLENFRLGRSHPLDFKPRPRWPLDPKTPIKKGAGAQGVPEVSLI